MRIRLTFAALSLGMLLAVPAVQAHHSFSATYDGNKPVTLRGNVTKLGWSNPHAHIYVDVKNPQLTHAVDVKSGRNLLPRNLKDSNGDKIAILIAPRKDGGDGGFIQAFTVNGKTVGFGGLSPVTGKPENASESGSSEPRK